MGYKNDDFEKFMSGESLFGSDRSKTNSDYDRSEDYDFSDSSFADEYQKMFGSTETSFTEDLSQNTTDRADRYSSPECDVPASLSGYDSRDSGWITPPPITADTASQFSAVGNNTGQTEPQNFFAGNSSQPYVGSVSNGQWQTSQQNTSGNDSGQFPVSSVSNGQWQTDFQNTSGNSNVPYTGSSDQEYVGNKSRAFDPVAAYPYGHIAKVKDTIKINLILAFIGLAMVAAGIFFFYLSVKEINEAKEFFRNAELTAGIVQHIDQYKRETEDNTYYEYKLTVKYVYGVSQYTSETETIGVQDKKRLNITGVGSPVPIYVDTRHPSSIRVVDNSDDWPNFMDLLLSVVGIIILAVDFRMLTNTIKGRMWISRSRGSIIFSRIPQERLEKMSFVDFYRE